MKNPVKLKDFLTAITMLLHDGSGRFKILIVFILLNGSVTFAQVGVHTDFPDASSAMDISATNKGLLIPRVTLSENLDDPSPVNSPAVGLLVFNSGANQEMGFYYWDGTFWVPLAGGGGGGNGWSLTGNYGTEVGTNFIGTTDAEDFAVYTNAAERMRVLANGQVVIDSTAARSANALLSVFGNETQNYAINAYSSAVAIYAMGSTYGTVTRVTNATGWPLYSKNYNASGYGAMTVGSNISGAGYWDGRSAGLNSWGIDGIHAYGRSTTAGAAGVGIMAAGNALTPVYLPEGAGGTFRGFWGAYGRSSSPTGTGVIGLGNNTGSPSYLAVGSGGAFTGFDGVFGKSINVSGSGVIGLGNNLVIPSTLEGGSGGAFTGTNVGASGWGATNGLIGWGVDNTNGVGVAGGGNNLIPPALPGGGGGAFIGTSTGSSSWATSATGTGVVGAGNNTTASIYASGSGGAFTGTICGVYGYATNTNNSDRYGGYFATSGAYAYVGVRYSNTNRKILGTNSVSTIVKNTKGELIALTCPEAPEIVFQDFGIGQLVNGRTHIIIDPDLAVNINVSEKHPLKVYITPEGDCNGVYVTNKSANGFDVIELQGGHSNVPFSWQIVATRADEAFLLKNGTTEVSDNGVRFPPAPGPLEMLEQPHSVADSNSPAAPSVINTTTTRETKVLTEERGGHLIEIRNEPDGK